MSNYDFHVDLNWSNAMLDCHAAKWFKNNHTVKATAGSTLWYHKNLPCVVLVDKNSSQCLTIVEGFLSVYLVQTGGQIATCQSLAICFGQLIIVSGCHLSDQILHIMQISKRGKFSTPRRDRLITALHEVTNRVTVHSGLIGHISA